MLAIDFLFDFAFVESFSVTWSWVISTFNLLCRRLLIILAHNAHFHLVLILIIGLSFSIMSISWSSTLLSILVDITKVIVAWLSHRCLNIRILSRSMLHSTMWLKCTTATLNLSMTWQRLSIIRLLLQLVLVVRMNFIVGGHWTVSLLVDRSIGILIWILFDNYHLFWVWLILSVILSMEISLL